MGCGRRSRSLSEQHSTSDGGLAAAQQAAACLPVTCGLRLLQCVPPACVSCSVFATQEVASVWEWHWGLGAVLGSQGTQLAVGS